MKHFIYAVHTCGGSRWSKGYMELYLTDKLEPIAGDPVMSVVVVHLGETEEIMMGDVYRPSKEVPIRITRAFYHRPAGEFHPIEGGYGIKEQKVYLFEIVREDIPNVLKSCCDDVDAFLVGRESMDVNDPRNGKWNYRVGG